MPFSEEQLEEIYFEYATIEGKCRSLQFQFTQRIFANPTATEHATHGFSRRLKVLMRCIDQVFELLPPDLDEIPTDEQVTDAVIYIQASIFNIFGCMDNAAWIWVYEKGITRDNGKPLPSSWVGIRGTNKIIRDTFSPDFRSFLEGLDSWFDLLENYRHALAHRIPLYIPPYIVDPKDMPEHQRLDQSIVQARLQNLENEVDRLTTEQNKLTRFDPIMTHSFEENSKQVIFHPQLLANFNTLHEFGHKFLDELDR